MEHFLFGIIFVCLPRSNWLIDRRNSQKVGGLQLDSLMWCWQIYSAWRLLNCCVTVWKSMEVYKNYGGNSGVVWMELCYGRTETLEDVEDFARLCGCNLVWWGSGLRRCDIRRCGIVVFIRSCAGGVWDHRITFRWYNGAWGMIRGWQMNRT